MKFKPKFLDPVAAYEKRHSAINASFDAAKRDEDCFVVIPNVSLVDEDMSLIISSLQANPEITNINLSGNFLGESVPQLAEIDSLKIVNLAYNHCDIDDLLPLLDCDHIEELGLEGIDLKPEDAKVIAKKTKQFKLDLSGGTDSDFSDQDNVAIQQALQHNRKQQAQSQGSLDFPLVNKQFNADDSTGIRSDVFLNKIFPIK